MLGKHLKTGNQGSVTANSHSHPRSIWTAESELYYHDI